MRAEGSRHALTLTCSLTQIVGPAVPGLVLVGEPGIEWSSAVALELRLDVLSHFQLCWDKHSELLSGGCY